MLLQWVHQVAAKGVPALKGLIEPPGDKGKTQNAHTDRDVLRVDVGTRRLRIGRGFRRMSDGSGTAPTETRTGSQLFATNGAELPGLRCFRRGIGLGRFDM